uniref:Uncharacterized protein n=1 Tax=Falco tinnunculus TaxID=100819 RepID=A0A8C4ULF7_FALTI
MLLARVAVEPGAILPILLPVLPVGHVHDDQKGRASDKDELQGPELDVGDGEKLVVADIGAAWLPCVAVKVLLLISPHALSCHHIDQHMEDEDHREPDAAKGCGVFVDPAEQRLQRFPVHGSWWRPESPNLEKQQQKPWVKSSGRWPWGSSSLAALNLIDLLDCLPSHVPLIWDGGTISLADSKAHPHTLLLTEVTQPLCTSFWWSLCHKG